MFRGDYTLQLMCSQVTPTLHFQSTSFTHVISSCAVKVLIDETCIERDVWMQRHCGDCDLDFDLGSFVLLLTDSCTHYFFSVVQYTGDFD